jgi:hypothetical protein
LCDFEELNLMWAGADAGVERSPLSLGQAFRTSVNARSLVNSHQPPLRPSQEPRRQCEDFRYHSDCPYVAREKGEP